MVIREDHLVLVECLGEVEFIVAGNIFTLYLSLR